MPAQLVENIQYFGSDGLPLVGGQIYIGTVALEPIGNLISIFSDEALTVSIANPQTIGADGFSANKIYIPAKYSLRVNTVLGAQFLLDLNVGASAGTGTTSLKSVLGTNAITAEGEASVVTSLVDKEVYTLKIANTNDGTSGVTLKIDATDALSIVKNFNQPIDPGDFTQNQIIRVQHNSTSNNFAWVDSSVTTKRITKGADVASATSITIPDNDGNYRDITGAVTIATINGVKETFQTFQMDSTARFTNSASIIIPGGVDHVSQAGDVIELYMLTASTCIFTDVTKANGLGTIAGIVIQKLKASTNAVATTATTLPYDDTIPQITEGGEFLTQAITPKRTDSIIEITVNCLISHSIVTEVTLALFRDAVANGLAATAQLQSSVSEPMNMTLVFEEVSGSLTARTYRFRAGGNGAGTLTINGQSAGRKFGGVSVTSMTVEERLP